MEARSKQPPRSVRVIPPDGAASSPLGTRASSDNPVRRSTDAVSSSEPSSVARKRAGATDGAAGGQAPRPSQELAGAPEEQARIGTGAIAADGAAVPLPPTRPEHQAQGLEPGRNEAASTRGREIAKHDAAPTPVEPPESPRATRKRHTTLAEPSERRAQSTDRQETRRSNDRSGKRQEATRRKARKQHTTEGEVETAEVESEARWFRDEVPRTRREAPVRREPRQAEPEIDDDSVVVRSYRQRDGRRLTVYEQRVEEPRRALREEPPPPRMPLFFNLFNPRQPDD
jgi:hypothetical protein